jgi:ribosomal protein S18 acetylase RimI-like enzyme
MIEYRPLITDDFDAVIRLWNTAAGVRANETPEEFARILARNPNLSSCAVDGADMVGAVLACHDGRRGYLYHLAVAASHLRRGIGAELVRLSLQGFKADGIRRASLFVISNNQAGAEFWRSQGWFRRDDLNAWSIDLG